MSNSPWTFPLTRFRISFRARAFRSFPSRLFTLLFVLACCAGIEAAAQSSTNLEIGSTVLHTPVKRLGINLAGQTYYDSGQMLRDLIFQNPGFEGELWQSILHCAAATANTCTDDDNYNYWPANFMQGASFEFIYGSAKGQTGTVSASTAGSQGGASGITLTFSSPLSPAPSVGDYVIVRQKFPGNAQAGWWTSTSGGGTLSTETSDIASDSPGVQALSMSAAGSGQSASVNQTFDSTSGRSFVQLNGTYTLTFKAKGMGGNNQMNVSAVRLAGAPHSLETFLDQNVNLTGQWQDYSYTFNASEDGTYIGPAQVIFSVSGGNAYLDDVALTESAAADNPTPFRNAVVDRLKQLQPGVIRYMDSGTDFGSTIDNMLAVPFARQRTGYAEFESTADDVPMGLHEFLQLCQAVGAEPWYTMQAGMSTTEMQNLIQYLGGDASTPYGAIRAQLGQTTPWTSVFPVIHLEFGNEMWNGGAFGGEDMLDPVGYGNRAAAIFAAARSSASYNSSSFDLVIDSQAVNPWLTGQILSNSSGYDTVDAAPYIFDELNDYSSNEAIYGSMFAEPEAIDSVSSGYMAQQAQAAATGGSTPAKLAIYEVNLGTVAGTAPQSTLTSVVGSVGAGIAVADHMLLMLRDQDITTQNLFALPEYENGYTNTAGGGGSTPLWGSVIDMGGETNVDRPTFLAEELANSAILPTELAITTTGSNPTWNQPLSSNNNIQLANAHYLQSFAFTDGTHNSVIVFNLSRSGSLPVTFSGANAPTGDVLISQLTSQNPTDNNENVTSDTPVVSNTETNVSNFNPATAYSLPPFSMTVFTWPGSTLPATTTSLTASPTSATTGQSITLTATVASQAGSNTPTGTVTFLNGATTLGTAQLNASGVASMSTTSLPAGTDPITASYGGDSNDAGSTSSAVPVSITSNAVATTTALTASPTQINTGQSVTFTATVAPQSGTTIPTGTVTFLNGTSTLGSATLNASGTATFSTSVLPAGADSITASYGGSSSDASSVSSAVTINVTQTVIASTTSLAASATQITPGQNVVLTATVTPNSGSTIPTGTVTFFNGTATLGTGTLNASGAASLSTTTLPTGANSITASYGGSAGNSSSVSAAVVVNVAQAAIATTTTLTSSATQINTGQSVTFTAKVVPQTGSTIPTGTVAFLNGTSILGTATLNASGTATLSTTTLPAGSDSITASYGGSTTNSSSTSAAITVTVTQTLVATTTALTASATQINTGQSVTFTAVVSPASGSTTPSGTVTFLDGSTVLGTGTLNAGGAASLSTTSLAAGAQSITASYGGSTTNSSSVSAAVVVTVTQTQVSTSTALSASATTISSGQSITFTAQVSPQSGTTIPTGVVTFLNGSAVLGTGTLNASGVATLSTTSLPVGTDSITAAYGGSTGDSSSTSGAVPVTVTQTVVATTTTLSASAVQGTAGQSITFTARVVQQTGSTIPAGTVTFLDGTSVLGTASLNGGGRASFSTSALTSGTHTITASYGGSTSDSASVSAPVTITIAPAQVQTNTALAASSTAINTGQSVTFTATVTPQTGSTPVAQLPVAFLNGSEIIGTVTTNASGVAVFTTTSLRAGADSITASYTGNNVDLSSVSNPIVVNVTQSTVPTTTSLSASATQITTAQGVTLTATVSPTSGTRTPRGTVTFLDGTTSLGTGTLNSSGVAFLAVNALSAGSHGITASYSGNTSNGASVSSPVTIMVTQAEIATTTSLTSSATAISTGQNITFTAKVTPQSGSVVPTGTVAFLDGSTILGTATLNGAGIATFSTTSLPAGTQSIAASYQGSSSNSTSISAAVAVVVTQSVVSTVTTLTASATEISSGQNLIFTATVAQQAGSTVPTGTVTFLDGATALGTGILNAGGTAFFATTALGVGSHTITASYNGSTGNAKSASAAVTVMVTQSVVATTTSLAASTKTTMLGQNIVFTAMVAAPSGSPVPTGAVALLDGGFIIATAPLNASGAATFNITSLAIGTHSITASYGGSNSNSSSFSAAISVQVTPDEDQGAGPVQTAITLTSSIAQPATGQNVTFTAAVTSQGGSVMPTGIVTFLDGSATLGSAVLAGGSASFTTANLSQGTHLITAVYDGDALHLVSISQVLTIVVTAPAPTQAAGPAITATTATLTASATQVTAGQSITFTANIAPQSGSGKPTGTVTFLDGQTALGATALDGNGNATFSTTQLAAGTHSITVSYGGDAADAPSTSAPITVTVNPPGTPSYTMTVSNSDVSVSRGQIANLTVTLTPVNGFNMPVNLICSGMPAGTSCSFNPPTVTPDGAPVSSTLSILVAASNTTAQNRSPGGPFGGRLAFGLVMPWGLVSLLGLSKRKNRSRVAAWSVRLVVMAALIAGSLWVSGCGYSVNGSVFTMTLTATGQNVPTQTSHITVSIAP